MLFLMQVQHKTLSTDCSTLYGVSGWPLDLFNSLLDERMMKVTKDSDYAAWIPVSISAPQTSVLLRLLYILYLSLIWEHVHKDFPMIFKCADGVCARYCGRSADTGVFQLSPVEPVKTHYIWIGTRKHTDLNQQFVVLNLRVRWHMEN